MQKVFRYCFVFCIFMFISIIKVNADCSCYLLGEYSKDNVSLGASYLLELKFSTDKTPRIIYFGENLYPSSDNPAGSYDDVTDEFPEEQTNSQQITLDSEGNYSSIFEKVEAEILHYWTKIGESGCPYTGAEYSCNTLTIYYDIMNGRELLWETPNPLLPSGYRSERFIAITAEDYLKLKNSDNISEILNDMDKSGVHSGEVEAIKQWAQATDQLSVEDVGDPCSVISGPLSDTLTMAVRIISIAGIILVVVMTAISFVKAIIGSDDEKLKNAFSHLITRIIVVVILLLLPMILTFIINLVNNSAEGTVKIGNDGNPFCDITK